LKKKKQKNFYSGIHYHPVRLVLPPCRFRGSLRRGRRAGKKFFCFFFFKKEDSCFLAFERSPSWAVTAKDQWRAGLEQGIELAVGLGVVDAAKGGQHALARGGAVAGVLYQLQVAARPGRLDAEEHAGSQIGTTSLAGESGKVL